MCSPCGNSALRRFNLTFLSQSNYKHCPTFQDASLTWAAERAVGSRWFQAALETLQAVQRVRTAVNLKLQRSPEAPERRDDPTFDEQFQNLQQFATLCIEMASGLCWSQVIFTIGPSMIAGVFHPEHDIRQEVIRLFRRAWEAILHAEDCLRGRVPDVDKKLFPDIARVLKDIAFQETQVGREMYEVVRRGGFQATDPETRALAHVMYAKVATTKFHLEDMFSHLSTVSKRGVKNLKLNRSLARTQATMRTTTNLDPRVQISSTEL